MRRGCGVYRVVFALAVVAFAPALGATIPEAADHCIRRFLEQDDAQHPYVAIINEKFARFYFGNQNPIGRRIGPEGDHKPPDYTIVGIAKDGKYATL